MSQLLRCVQVLVTSDHLLLYGSVLKQPCGGREAKTSFSSGITTQELSKRVNVAVVRPTHLTRVLHLPSESLQTNTRLSSP